jgi:transposase-like protein
MADVNARIAERNIPIGQDIQSYLKRSKRDSSFILAESSCAAAAKAVGFSAKTVSKRYNRLRERSAAEREAEPEKLEVESIVHPDGWKAYNKLSLNGFHHRRINHDKTLVDGKQRPR